MIYINNSEIIMTKFESSQKKIHARRKPVFGFLSDINNFRSFAPEDKIKNFHAETDRCSFSVDGVGEIGVRIASIEPDDTIKFESEGSKPFKFNLWIQLKAADDKTTVMKLTLGADLNMMMKAVAEKPLKEGIEIIASQLSDHLNKREWV